MARQNEDGNDLGVAMGGAPLRATFPSSFARMWGLALLCFYAYVLVRYELTAQILGLGPVQFGKVLLWVFVLLVANLVVYWLLGHYLSTILFSIITGRTYIYNHLSFRMAGGYHIPMMANLLALVGGFGYYWWTLKTQQEPIAFARSLWGYIKCFGVIQLLFVVLIDTTAFISFRMRRKYEA